MTCIAEQLPQTIARHHQRRQAGFAPSNQKRRISRAREPGSARRLRQAALDGTAGAAQQPANQHKTPDRTA